MSQGKQLLQYYQSKIDELYKERLAWLSKFQQCSTFLKEKQQLMHQLKDYKDKQLDLHRGIVHHEVALLDQKLNVVRMHRDNINNEFVDAEQILKMEELMEEYPEELEKHLPCNFLGIGGDIIDNELNIHAKGKKSKQASFNIFRESNSVLSSGKSQNDVKIKYKPTKEQLLKRQIIELKNNQQQQICVLKQQKRKLQDLLLSVRDKEDDTLKNERDIVDKLRNQLSKQDQKHKLLAQKYFNARKKLKEEHQQTEAEHSQLNSTLATLDRKVNEQTKIYEKENKAKQTLIIRKSEDFQQDYKAKMRAKERNLQALRDNYQKMQEVCIEKIKQLEETLTIAKHKLNETEQKREKQISSIKTELFVLQKQVAEERVEKARIDEQMRYKIQQDKRRRLMQQQLEEEERKKHEKAKLIEQAYKKHQPKVDKYEQTKVDKYAKTMKQKQNKSSKKRLKPVQAAESQQSQEESIAMSDLQNIQQQISKLQHNIQDKSKRTK